jgi:hypothetical protein
MKERFKGVTAAEAERLAALLKEMGEAIHIVGNILLHGYESTAPDEGPTHRKFLEKELGDVKHAIDRMCNSDDVNGDEIQRQAERQAQFSNLCLHHQGATS